MFTGLFPNASKFASLYSPSMGLFHLQAKHTQENCETWGVNGETGTLVDMKELGIWEPLAVKLQTYKTAVEVRHPKVSVLTTNCCALEERGHKRQSIP